MENKFRIIIEDHKWDNFVNYHLEEYKKRKFLPWKSWQVVTGGACHKDSDNGLIKTCVYEWQKAHPDAELIQNSTRYKYIRLTPNPARMASEYAISQVKKNEVKGFNSKKFYDDAIKIVIKDFLAGYNSRQKEIDDLNSEIKSLKRK